VDSTTSGLLIFVIAGLMGAGTLAFGLLVGYWRGVKRGKMLSAPSRDTTDLERLAGIGRAILGVQLRVDALCETVYQQSIRLVDTRNFQLGLFEGDDYAVKVWIRSGERLNAQRFRGSGHEGVIGWVRHNAQGLRVGDYSRDWEKLPARPSYDADKPPRAALFAPLIAAGDVIGVITVQSDQPDFFTDEDLRLLTVLANQAAGALRNAQLFEQTRDRARQLRLINDISRQITAIQPIPDLLRQIVQLVDEAFHFYAVSVFLHDPVTNLVNMGASSHTEFETRRMSVLPGQGLIGLTYAEAHTVSVPDVNADPRYLVNSALLATRSELCIPLSIESHVLGILDVQSDQVNGVNSDTISTLEALAGQLALALQEAQTYADARRQAERINALAEASRAVVSILDIDDLLDEVVDLVTDYFGYDRVHLFLRSGDEIVFRSGSGVHSGKWAIERLSYHLDDNGFIPCVVRSGQPLISGEVFTDVHYVPGAGVEDTRSELTVPIRMGARVLGVFDMQSPQPNAFDEQDVTLAQALADTIAIGLRNAGLFAAETRRRVLAETLREVSMGIAASLDLESVLDGILQGLARVVGSQAALIALLDDGANYYTVNAVRGDESLPDSWSESILGQRIPANAEAEQAVFALLHTLEHGQSPHLLITGLVSATGDSSTPEINSITPVKADTPSETLRKPHYHLYVSLPVGGQTIGYLAIDRATSEQFSPEEVEIVNTFAGQAAIAIANAQLYMAQREQAWIATALLQVAEATGRATNLDAVLGTVARITPMLVGVEWCAVFLNENKIFRIVEIEGAPLETSKLIGHTFAPGDWPQLDELIANGQPVRIPRGTPPPANLPMQLGDVGQAVLLPLYAKGEIMGALLIGQRDDSEPLNERKVELVSGIANQAALAIESAQLFAAQQEEQWVTTALLTVAESVNSTLGLTQTLETLARLTPMLVGVSRCGVFLWESGTHYFIGGAAYGLQPDDEAQFAELVLSPNGEPFLQALISNADGAPISVTAGLGAQYRIPASLSLFESVTLLGLPLIAKGTLVGAMIVDLPDGSTATSLADPRRMNILTGTAQQAALAIETARLQADSLLRQRMERELEVAQGIQRSFLPQQLPNVPGWELAVFYRAARQVGGDFYDFIPLKSGKWGIVIADVADKGVPAALFMVLSRTNLRAAAFGREQPVETLLRVNELLLSDSRSDLFVTCWYGVLDPTTGELVYANGGHNPPLLIRADGLSEELSGRGIALGVLESDLITIEERRTTIRPNDLLVAYTDGVTEALRSDGTEFGVVGLQSTSAGMRHRPAADVMKRIVQAVDTFTAGEPQFDDLTLVILKSTPPDV
jgi:GAF domain-containing protein